MSEIADFLDSYYKAPAAKAVTSLDQSPDEGARALELSRATGVDPQYIHSDLEGFETNQKASLTNELVSANPYLANYIRNHPLADVVSNDDYGNLDEFSRVHPWLSALSNSVDTSPGLRGIKGAATGFAEGFGGQRLGSWLDQISPGFSERAPYSALLISLMTGAEPLYRSLQAGLGMLEGGAEGFAAGAMRNLPGRTEQEAESFGREIGRGVVESEMGGGATHGGHVADLVQQGKAAREAAWINSYRLASRDYEVAKGMSMPPPRGTIEMVDEVRTKANEEQVKALGEKLDAATKSTTRDRDPEYFRNYVEQEFGDATISVSGDRVAEIYGTKLPAPDDNLLGWVPGIEEQLEAAKTMGADVIIPTTHWLAHVDKELAKELHDDIRTFPLGVTATEAKEKIEPVPVVAAAMPMIRDSGGLEPAFSIGDRKLTLKKFDLVGEWHGLQFLDQNDKMVGEMSILPDPAKKELYVGNISGMAGLYANSFGPALMMDLKRQLKAMYPEYEWLTGLRVSGARYASGAWEKAGTVRIRLDAPEGWETADTSSDYLAGRGVFEGAYIKNFPAGVNGIIAPKAEWLAREVELNTALREELDRIAPTAELVPTHGIGFKGGRAWGAYIHHPAQGISQVLIDLMSPMPMGTLKHETIHVLHAAGLFNDAEWLALVKASKEEGWLYKYKIVERYGHLNLPEATLHEEAIAEAFRDWWQNRQGQPQTPVTGAFQKIWDFLQRIKERFTQILGKEPTFDELFQRVESGEIGNRGVKEPLGESAAASLAEEPTDLQGHLSNLRAEVAGLDKKHYNKLEKLIDQRHQEDLEAALKRTERNQKKTQTKEWKANNADIRKEVAQSVRYRPDVAADLIIGGGEFGGQKLPKQRYPLRAEDLTDEQKAALPNHYYSKDGLPPDFLAKSLGYGSGDTLIENLVNYRSTFEGTARERLEQTIKNETAARMEEKYGQLDANIMSDARDQAISETGLNVLMEEWMGLAMSKGIQTVDGDMVRAEALRMFGELPQGAADKDRIWTALGKHSRLADRAMIEGKWADAVVSMQKKHMYGVFYSEARKFEREQAAAKKIFKRFSKREVDTTDPQYTNYIHDILSRVGMPLRKFGPDDIADRINGAGTGTLEKFTDQKVNGDGRLMPVWEQLFDPNWNKPYEKLTVAEARAVSNSVRTLAFNGRDELNQIRAGEERDWGVIKTGLIANIKDNAGKEISYNEDDTRRKGLTGKAGKILLNYGVSHVQMENLLNRFDGFDAKGLWNQYVMRDLIDSANRVDAVKKEFAKRLTALGSTKGMGKSVDNHLFLDIGGTPFDFTRKNLVTVMLNTGTGSNLAKLAEGYKIDPEELMAWVNKHATAEEWKWVQGVWDLFSDLKDRSDTMYRSMTGGVEAKNVPARPFETPHGMIKGGYYPIIYRKSEGPQAGINDVLQDNFIGIPSEAGYTKERTRYTGPLALNLDALPGRMAQVIHDIEMRPAIINTVKVFKDKDIRAAVIRHVGLEYADEFIPYIRGVANSSNYISPAQAIGSQVLEFMRQNVITSLVGLNPGTVLKHFPTAMVLSMREVGSTNFLRELKGLMSINEATGESNWAFARRNSVELQRRDRNWQETLFGAEAGLVPGENFGKLRQRVMEWSSKPVAMSDMLSAVPTWLAKYKEEIAKGSSEGDAIFLADRAVRRAHGSTAITNRTAIQRDANRWLTSVYNFFSDVMNRQLEMVWKAGATMDLAKQEGWKEAKKDLSGHIGNLFAYVLMPALIEELVSPAPPNQKPDEDINWGFRAAHALTFTLGSSWIGVRDLANAFLSGRDPQLGLYGTFGQELLHVFRDFDKDDPFSEERMGRLLLDAVGFVSALTGFPTQIGKTGRYLYDVNAGNEVPEGPWAWLTGLRFGSTKHHSTTWDNYIHGINQ